MKQASQIQNHGLVITVEVEYDMGEPFTRDGIPLAVWAAEAARDLNNRIVARQREAAAQREAEDRARVIEGRNAIDRRRREYDQVHLDQIAKRAKELTVKKAAPKKGKKK
jgi:hypothetical protein